MKYINKIKQKNFKKQDALSLPKDLPRFALVKGGPVLSEVEGFALIEILMVVSIIGIIGSIAFFSLTDSKKKTNETAIISNLIAIMPKAEIYFSEYKNYLGLCPHLSKEIEELEKLVNGLFCADNTYSNTDFNYGISVIISEGSYNKHYSVDKEGVVLWNDEDELNPDDTTSTNRMNYYLATEKCNEQGGRLPSLHQSLSLILSYGTGGFYRYNFLSVYHYWTNSSRLDHYDREESLREIRIIRFYSGAYSFSSKHLPQKARCVKSI